MLFEEVASWLQNDFYDFSSWEIYDQDGEVDIDSQHDPRDGERYITFSPEVSEELKGTMETRFTKFLQATRWRRIKSRYKIEVFQEQPEGSPEMPGFGTVAEAIHRKHVRYRTRWKQKKKILAQPMESSPLCEEFTSIDESTIQDQVQTPTIDRSGRVDNHVEPHLKRGSRDCRPSLDRLKRGKPGSTEEQPSHPRIVEDSDRFEGQEGMDSESDVTDTQVCSHDHDPSTAKLASAFRKDSELDDRLQTSHIGTENHRTGILDPSETAHKSSREDSKVMGEVPLPKLNQSIPQAGLERERELTDDHDQGIPDGRTFNQALQQDH
jgi:hypothetical protein